VLNTPDVGTPQARWRLSQTASAVATIGQ